MSAVATVVSVAVGLSVLLGSMLAVGRYVGRLEAHLAQQDTQIARMRRQLARVHAAVTDEEDEDDADPSQVHVRPREQREVQREP